MTKQMQWKMIDQIFCRSMKCRKCFNEQLAEPAFIDIAQPRWIGFRYFESPRKMLIITPYPGSGPSRKLPDNIKFRDAPATAAGGLIVDIHDDHRPVIFLR